jgi:hypothetical protein
LYWSATAMNVSACLGTVGMAAKNPKLAIGDGQPG